MLKNMSVGARLLLLGGTLIVMIGLVAGVGITRLSSLGEIITEIAEEDIPLGSKITEVTTNQLEQAVAFEQALRHAQLMDKSAAERTAFKHAVDRFEEHAELADEEIKEAEELVRHGQEVYGTNAAALAEYKKLEEMFQSLDKHHAAYEEHARAVFVTLAQGQIHEGMEAAEKVEEEEKRVDKEAEEALYEIQRFTLLEAQNAEAMELSAVRFLWGLSVTAILLAAFASYALGRSISKPLGEAERVLREVADGDFTQTFHYEAKDEIGRMGQALTALLQKLRSSMTDIAANAETLSTSSEELSAVSEQMSGNAEETAKQSSVTAATSEQVSRNVSTVATSAEEITASIKEVAKSATASARIASEAVDVASKTNATITRLGESSNEIGNVLKMITSIAQQTNLLALNATIEAARAGEAGKGFAVVANEVKELARQTAEATEEISQKVERLQDDSRQSVAAIAQITEVIEKINGISSSIATSVEEQSTTTAEMGRNLVEAAQGTTEISSNVTGVAKAAESTTTGANQTRESAAELARMAGVLKQTVSQFKYN